MLISTDSYPQGRWCRERKNRRSVPGGLNPECWFVREDLPDCHKIFVKRYHEPPKRSLGGAVMCRIMDRLTKRFFFIILPNPDGDGAGNERKEK